MQTPPRLPSRRLLREIEALGEIVCFPARAPELARQPRRNGETVLVLPGFGANDWSTLPLRSYLRWLGYDVEGWGFGTNRGDVPNLIPSVTERVAAVATREGRPVRLVGWSLGGYLAREAARERPDPVERVVTLGTFVVGGPR